MMSEVEKFFAGESSAIKEDRRVCSLLVFLETVLMIIQRRPVAKEYIIAKIRMPVVTAVFAGSASCQQATC
jgi:hypothetical protein